MWWVGSRPRDLYLGTGAVHIGDGRDVVLSGRVDGWEEGLAAALDFLSATPDRRRVRVWLSGRLCRPCLLPAIRALSDNEEKMKVAAALAGESTGMGGEVHVWMEASGRARTPLVVAADKHVLARLGEDALGRPMASIRPWWSEVLNYSLTQPNIPMAVAVRDCDSLTVLAGRESDFLFASTYFPPSGRDAAESAFVRAMLSADVPPGPRRIWGLSSAAVEAPADCALGALMEHWS